MAASFADFGIDVDRQPDSRGEVSLLCPQCSAGRKKDRVRCLSVNVEKGTWFCQHCEWSGGLALGTGIFTPNRKRVFAKPDELSLVDLTIKAQHFFIERKISLTVVRKHGITATDAAIKFPMRRDGELINIKTRYPDKKFSVETDCELIFWGLDDCKGAEQVIIVEGEMDKLALETAGLPHVLSVPNGANIGKMDYLASAEQFLAGVGTVILAGDADDPGRELTEELARRIGREKCARVTWPPDCKDANDVLKLWGEDVLRQCISDHEMFPLPGIVGARNIRADIKLLYHEGRQPGVSTGLKALDLYYTVKPGQMTIVTGIPNIGKSEVLDALMMNLVRQQGWNFAVFTPENFPVAHYYSKLAEKYTGFPFGVGPNARMTEGLLDGFLDWVDGRIEVIDLEDPTIESILERARQLVLRNGIKGLIVDPWNEIEHTRPSSMTETEYIGQCLSRIRRFGRHHDLHVWIVAHPKKIYSDSKDSAPPVPTPYDINGSANWYNKADNILVIHRDKTNDLAPFEVHVQKIRFREIGRLGMAKLQYDRVTGCISDVRDSQWG